MERDDPHPFGAVPQEAKNEDAIGPGGKHRGKEQQKRREAKGVRNATNLLEPKSKVQLLEKKKK